MATGMRRARAPSRRTSAEIPLLLLLPLISSLLLRGPHPQGVAAKDIQLESLSFYPQPVGTQYKYNFNLFGRFIANGNGDPIMNGTATISFDVTKFDLSRVPTQDYSLVITVTVFNFKKYSGSVSRILLGRSSAKGTGLNILNVTGRVTNARGVDKATIVYRLTNTTTRTCPELRYATVSKAFEYLTLYPKNNFLQITTSTFTKGAIRGQLVNVAGYPIVP